MAACDQALGGQDFGYRVGPLLSTTTDALSTLSGGTIPFTLSAPDEPGALYVLLGSLSGTDPGLALAGGVTLPLNFDAYTQFTADSANNPLLSNTLSTLSPLGQSTAAFTVGPGQIPLGLIGATMNHAYLTFSLDGQSFSATSNPVATLVFP